LRYLVFFGSRARGLGDPLSDWDFAARFGRRVGLLERLGLMGEIARRMRSDDVDLVVLDDPGTPPPLLVEALWGGEPICVEDEEAFHWDRAVALGMYWDWRIDLWPGLRELVEAYAGGGVGQEG